MKTRTLILAVSLVVAACGDGDADEAVETPTTTTTAVETTTTAQQTPDTTAEDAGDPPIELDGTSWAIDAYALPSGGLTNPWPATEVTVMFANSRMSGSTGCNEFSATYAVEGGYDEFEDGVRDAADGQVITLTEFEFSDETCEDEDYALQADEIAANLERVGRWVLIRGELNLRTDDGAFLMSGPPAG